MRRTLVTVLVVATAATLVGSAASVPQPPLVVVTLHGGLCVSGKECRSVYRITPLAVTGPSGGKPLAVSPAEARKLGRAIAQIRLADVRRHPFSGTCPTAYDGQEAIYAFRGLREKLASCRYDLSRVQAVRIASRLVERARH